MDKRNPFLTWRKLGFISLTHVTIDKTPKWCCGVNSDNSTEHLFSAVHMLWFFVCLFVSFFRLTLTKIL